MYRESEKKLFKQQYLLHTSLQHGELGPLTAETGSGVCGTPANFNRFRVLASLLQRRRTALQQRASAKLCGVVQGMELLNFRRGRHGRPSRLASAHILASIFIPVLPVVAAMKLTQHIDSLYFTL